MDSLIEQLVIFATKVPYLPLDKTEQKVCLNQIERLLDICRKVRYQEQTGEK